MRGAFELCAARVRGVALDAEMRLLQLGVPMLAGERQLLSGSTRACWRGAQACLGTAAPEVPAWERLPAASALPAHSTILHPRTERPTVHPELNSPLREGEASHHALYAGLTSLNTVRLSRVGGLGICTGAHVQPTTSTRATRLSTSKQLPKCAERPLLCTLAGAARRHAPGCLGGAACHHLGCSSHICWHRVGTAGLRALPGTAEQPAGPLNYFKNARAHCLVAPPAPVLQHAAAAGAHALRPAARGGAPQLPRPAPRRLCRARYEPAAFETTASLCHLCHLLS